MNNNRPSDIIIENAELWMQTRNFSGVRDRFGNSKPQFCIFLPDNLGEALGNDGWNVKFTKPRDPEDKPRPYLTVSFMYGHDNPRFDPKIWKITTNNKFLLNAETVGSLDYDEIKNVDIIITPYPWNSPTGSGIKAYVKEMYVTIEESAFMNKYFGTPSDDEDTPF